MFVLGFFFGRFQVDGWITAVLPGQQQATHQTGNISSTRFRLKFTVKHLKEIQAGSLLRKKKEVLTCLLNSCTRSSFQLNKAAAKSLHYLAA